MSSQDPIGGPDPKRGTEPPELDINGNPIPAKNLFDALASADTPTPEKKPPAAHPSSTLRPLSGGLHPGPAPRPSGDPPSSTLPGVVAGYDLAGNPLPSNAPSPGGSFSTARPSTPGAGVSRAGRHGLDPIGGAGYGRRYTTTVNGGLILALGIGGLIFYPVAPVAWVMGNNAIGAIKRGDANPTPRGQANAGRICGIIGTTLAVLLLGIYAALSVLMPGFSPFPASPPAPHLAPAPAHIPPKHHSKAHLHYHM